MPSYTLGAVKKHVEDAAYKIGPMFGIKTIYGFSGGSIKGSDHPKGLALDFMINNIPNGKNAGDQLAAHCVGNVGVYGITYVIWYRRIWENGQWTDYHGTSNPHTDHVHVSFSPTPGSGSASSDTGTVTASTSFLDTITSGGTWLRLGGMLAGSVILFWGIWQVVKNGK